MDVTKLVIACHSERQHGTLNMYKLDGTFRELNGAIYVDTSDKEGTQWDDIDDNSKEVIWSKNCPVFPSFIINKDPSEVDEDRIRKSDEILTSIMNESKKKLKLGGKIVFPISSQHNDIGVKPKHYKGFTVETKDNLGEYEYPAKNSALKVEKMFIYTKIGEGGQRKMYLKTIRKSHKKEKKFDAVFVYPDGHQKVVPFGQKGYSDFTKHKDKTRKARYLKRHSGMGEHWNKPDTPGALSKWILWNKPSFKESVKDFKKRFQL